MRKFQIQRNSTIPRFIYPQISLIRGLIMDTVFCYERTSTRGKLFCYRKISMHTANSSNTVQGCCMSGERDSRIYNQIDVGMRIRSRPRWTPWKRSEHRAAGVPLTGMLIREHTRKIYKTLSNESEKDFFASEGFSLRFKWSHGIRQLRIVEDSRCADLEAAEAFIPKFKKYVKDEGLVAEQVYNTDKTGLTGHLGIKRFQGSEGWNHPSPRL